MSTRIQNLTVIVVGALAVACSKPATESPDRTPPSTPSEQIPTLAAQAPAAEQQLVSALESGERSELKLVRPAEKKPPQQVAVKGKGEVPGETAGGTLQPSIDIGEVSPSVATASQAPVADEPIAVGMGSVPSGPALGGNGSGGGVGQEPGLMPERGSPGTIIIRGGMGGIDDDCKRHPNGSIGYPGGGIAINNRMPPMGTTPVLANNPSRRPFTPGRMGGTGGLGVGRRGIR